MSLIRKTITVRGKTRSYRRSLLVRASTPKLGIVKALKASGASAALHGLAHGYAGGLVGYTAATKFGRKSINRYANTWLAGAGTTIGIGLYASSKTKSGKKIGQTWGRSDNDGKGALVAAWKAGTLVGHTLGATTAVLHMSRKRRKAREAVKTPTDFYDYMHAYGRQRGAGL